MKVRYTDGMTIDAAGEYRIIRKSDGLYVVGHGMICPVDSREEGNNLIESLRGEKR